MRSTVAVSFFDTATPWSLNLKKPIHLSVVLAAMIAPLVLAGCSPDKPPATSTPEAQKSMMEGMKSFDKKSDKAVEKPAEKAHEKK